MHKRRASLDELILCDEVVYFGEKMFMKTLLLRYFNASSEK